jgi:hypothetical protein
VQPKPLYPAWTNFYNVPPKNHVQATKGPVASVSKLGPASLKVPHIHLPHLRLHFRVRVFSGWGFGGWG